jgi:hypothetical protein
MRMKRANPAKWICPYSKTISQINQSLKNLSFIAEITGLELMISKLNRNKLLASIFQCLRQEPTIQG